MNRREFLKFSSCGLTFVAVGTTAFPQFWQGTSKAFAQISSRLDIEMVEVLAEMVDGRPVPMWAFKIDNGEIAPQGARIPGPALIAFEGERIRLRITNNIPNGGPHSFFIPGVVDSGPIPFEDDVDVEFEAPTAGTYLYYDNRNGAVNRVMGLHGALVVLPNPVGNFTPYSNPTENVRRLFGDLGTTDHFPGGPWRQGRNAVWVFNTIDPDKNAEAAASANGINPSTFTQASGPGRYLPQYFTINGKSGFFAAQHHHDGDEDDDHHDVPLGFSGRFSSFDLQANISFGGRIGEPMLIRNLNAGLMWHSPHIHGQHVYEIAVNGVVKENLLLLDTWAIPPLARVDLLHPFIRPPDIPLQAWPPMQEKFPLLYPMHDHNEISNTAAGGNYPHGMATHWQIDADLDPDAAVIRVDRAELRVRGGQLHLEGSNTTQNIHLTIHAGGHDGPVIGEAHVHGDGRWSFRGRGLKTLSSRMVTLVFHDADDPDIVHGDLMVPLNLR